MGNNKRTDQLAWKTIYYGKNYLDFNENDCAREQAEQVRAFELFPTHSASKKLFS